MFVRCGAKHTGFPERLGARGAVRQLPRFLQGLVGFGGGKESFRRSLRCKLFHLALRHGLDFFGSAVFALINDSILSPEQRAMDRFDVHGGRLFAVRTLKKRRNAMAVEGIRQRCLAVHD